MEFLNDKYRQAYDELPPSFRFTDARAKLGGTSDSSANMFVKKCIDLGLVRHEGKTYVKITGVPGVAP